MYVAPLIGVWEYPKYWVIPETSGLPEISGNTRYFGLPATRWFSKLNRVGSGIEWNTGYRVGFGYPQGTVLRTFFSKLLRTDSTFYDKFFSKKYLVWSFVRPSFSNGFRCLSVSILKSGRGGPPREYFILKWQRIALYGNGAVSAHDNQS